MNKLSETQVKEFKSKISAAFRKLRQAGYIAKKNFQCCQSCAWTELESEYSEDELKNVVFYHHQDNDNITNGYVWMAWSGDGETICKTFQEAGLKASWSAIPESRIRVSFD